MAPPPCGPPFGPDVMPGLGLGLGWTWGIGMGMGMGMGLPFEIEVVLRGTAWYSTTGGRESGNSERVGAVVIHNHLCIVE